jgi:MoaA/NifB/PqqE/SkfB family radical SAM enzyme
MTTAFLTLMTKCNRSCAYCFYETGYEPRGDPERILPVDKALLSALQAAGVDKLILTGGEPLLLDDLEDKVQLAADMGFFTLLLTNGDLLDASRLDRLLEAGLGSLSLSLDSLSEDAAAKAPWTLLKRLSEEPRIRPAVITPITRINLRSMPEIIRRVYELGLYLLIQPVFVPREHALHERASLDLCSPEEGKIFRQTLALWESCYGRSGYAGLVLDYYTRAERARPDACFMGTECVVVDSSGDVAPCFHRRDLTAGNLLTGDAAAVLARAFEQGRKVCDAHCFGEHCISLFSHL